jgi:hypothetical protein
MACNRYITYRRGPGQPLECDPDGIGFVVREWGDGRTFPRVRVFGGRLIVLAKGIRLDGPSDRPIDTTCSVQSIRVTATYTY